MNKYKVVYRIHSDEDGRISSSEYYKIVEAKDERDAMSKVSKMNLRNLKSILYVEEIN